MKHHFSVRHFSAFAILLAVLLAPSISIAQENEADNFIASLDWKFGPTEAPVPGGGTFNVPEGYAFLDVSETAKFQEFIQNIPTQDQTLFAPTSLQWFAVFQFDPTGFIRDDEEIDANAILEGIRQGQAEANKELKRRGWMTMTIDGWAYSPYYDPNTRRLEWAIIGTNHPGETKVVNFNTRILGRRGVMKVTLVTEPTTIQTDVPAFKTALVGFDFLPDERYAAFKEGDKVAAYGLGALILGGAAAAAAKSGVLKSLGKFVFAGIFVALAALWAGLKRLFQKRNNSVDH